MIFAHNGTSFVATAPRVRTGAGLVLPRVTWVNQNGTWRVAGQIIIYSWITPENPAYFYGAGPYAFNADPGVLYPNRPTYGPLQYVWEIVSGPGYISSGQGTSQLWVDSTSVGVMTLKCTITDPVAQLTYSDQTTVRWQ